MLASLYKLSDRIGRSYAFAVVSLCALVVVVTWGSWRAWDLPVADGATYYKVTRNWVINGVPTGEIDALLYTMVYYPIFHLLPTDAIGIYSAHRVVTLMLTALSIYVLLRQRVHPVIAWALGAYAALIAQNLHWDYPIHVFAIALVALLCSVALQVGRWMWGSIVLIVGILFVTLGRPEYVLAAPLMLILLTGWDLWFYWLTFTWRTRLLYAAFVVGLSGIILWMLEHLLFQAFHQWIAFGQNFAWGYSERHPEWAGNYFRDWESITYGTFGNDAYSTLDALRANPTAFFEHVFHNLAISPGYLQEAIFTTNPVRWVYYAGLVAVVVLAVFAVWRPQVQGNPFARDPKLWITFLACAAVNLLSAVLLRPRPIYLISLQPLILFSVALVAQYAIKPRWLDRATPFLPLVALVFVWLYPSPYNINVGRSVVETSKVLEAMGEPAAPYAVLGRESFAFCAYADWLACTPLDYVDLPAYDDVYPMDYITANNVQAVILSDEFLNLLDEDLRGFYWTLGQDPGRFGWDFYGSRETLYRVVAPKRQPE